MSRRPISCCRSTLRELWTVLWQDFTVRSIRLQSSRLQIPRRRVTSIICWAPNSSPVTHDELSRALTSQTWSRLLILRLKFLKDKQLLATCQWNQKEMGLSLDLSSLHSKGPQWWALMSVYESLRSIIWCANQLQLLAWAIGDFEYVEAMTKRKYQGRSIPVRVYTTRGLKEQARFALECAHRTVDYFSEVFEIEYPLPKADLLAVHEFVCGIFHFLDTIRIKLTALIIGNGCHGELGSRHLPYDCCVVRRGQIRYSV